MVALFEEEGWISLNLAVEVKQAGRPLLREDGALGVGDGDVRGVWEEVGGGGGCA